MRLRDRGEVRDLLQGIRPLLRRGVEEQVRWIARPRPKISRAELERLASAYHRGRQEVTGAEVCCDVETREHCGCDGWNAFDNVAIEDLYKGLTGRQVTIG